MLYETLLQRRRRPAKPDLRTLRRQLGLTQAELAAAIGVTRKTICEHETGKAPVPRERMLAVLCLAMLDAIAMLTTKSQDVP